MVEYRLNKVYRGEIFEMDDFERDMAVMMKTPIGNGRVVKM